MKNDLWHSAMKRATPVTTSVPLDFSSFNAKAQEQSPQKIQEKTPQELNFVEQSDKVSFPSSNQLEKIPLQEKTPQLQMAEEMFSPQLSSMLNSRCPERDLVKDTLPAIHGFTEAQEKAVKQGLPTFQYDKQTFDTQNPKQAKEKFMEYYRARVTFQKEYSFMEKKFSTESRFTPFEQIKFYGNLNQEITQAKDLPTAIFIHQIASEEVFSKNPNREEYNKAYNREEYNTEQYKEYIKERCKLDNYRNLSERLTNYYDLLASSGNPGVYPKDSKFNLMAPFAKSADGYFFPDLLSSGGDIYIHDKRAFIPELAHAFRNKNNALGETGQFIADGLKDILRLKSLGFTPQAQSRNYFNEGKMEYDAHTIVEPALKSYVNGELRTIPEMHFAIDQARQKKGYSFTPAYGVKGKILQGEIDFIDRIIKEKGDSKELQNLKTAAEKQLKSYIQQQQKPKQQRMRYHHGGGGHGGR